MKINEPRWLACGWIFTIIALCSGSLFAKFAPAWYNVHPIFQSGWFLTIWIIFIGFALWQAIRWKQKTKEWLPLAFLCGIGFILVGAIFALLQEKKELFSLQKNEIKVLSHAPTDSVFVQLTDCDFSNYRIRIAIEANAQQAAKELKPNTIAKFGGWRIFLVNVDATNTRATLKAVYNPYGTTFTYCGFCISLLSLALFLFKKSHFRSYLHSFFASKRCGKNRLSGRIWGKKMPIFLVLLLLSSQADGVLAQRTLPKSCAAEFGKVAVYYNGRVAPLETLCNDYAHELCGATRYADFSSEQLIIGWLLFPEEWFYEPFLKISNLEVRRALNLQKYAAPAALFRSDGSPRTDSLQSNRHSEKIIRQLARLQQIRQGTIFQIYPTNRQWKAPINGTLDDLSPQQASVFSRLRACISANDEAGCMLIIKEIGETQREFIEKPGLISVEVAYNCSVRYNRAAAFFLLIFASFLLFFKKKLRKSAFIQKIVFTTICLAGGYFWVQFVTRWLLARHVPLISGYETLFLLTILFLFFAILVWKRWHELSILSLFLGGLSLFTSALSFNNQSVTAMSALLDSPLLSLHVMVIMVAYAGFGLALIISVVVLMSGVFCGGNEQQVARTLVARRVIRVAVWLLSFGIVLGAVWANVSWGSYWSWDPKEVWALITVMVYLPTLLEGYFPKFRSDKFYHCYIAAAFICVLITYFGVNFVFGGMHRY